MITLFLINVHHTPLDAQKCDSFDIYEKTDFEFSNRSPCSYANMQAPRYGQRRVNVSPFILMDWDRLEQNSSNRRERRE